MLNEKNVFLFVFLINKKSGLKLTYNLAKLSGQGERYNKKRPHHKPCMPEKAVKSGTHGRKNKVLKNSYRLDEQQ